jgi:hypothetical protein
MIRIIAVLVLIGAAVVPTTGMRTGGDAGAFTDLGAGARATALEGVFVSVADDAWAVFYNPAGMDQMALHFAWAKGFGGSLATGRPPTYYFGLSAKVISTKIYEYSDGGFGLDLGFLLKPANRLNVGFAVENVVSPQITLLEHGDSYPVRGRAGLAYDVGGYGTAAAEIRVDDDSDYEFAVAGEARPVKVLAFRGGYEAVYGTWAVGTGVRVNPILADFSYRPHRELGDSYIVTVGINF